MTKHRFMKNSRSKNRTMGAKKADKASRAGSIRGLAVVPLGESKSRDKIIKEAWQPASTD